MRRLRTNRTVLRDEISSLLRRVAFSQTAVRICKESGDARMEQFLATVLAAEIENREGVRKARFLHEVDIPVKPATDSGRYLPPECQQNGAYRGGRFESSISACLRKDSPLSSILSAFAKRRSQMASATVGSPRVSCQVAKGR